MNGKTAKLINRVQGLTGADARKMKKVWLALPGRQRAQMRWHLQSEVKRIARTA